VVAEADNSMLQTQDSFEDEFMDRVGTCVALYDFEGCTEKVHF
jgi:hypothetical protein